MITKTEDEAVAEPNFKIGDCVEWDNSGGTAEGKIVRVARESGNIKDFVYQASADDPRYIIEIDEGKHAAHKAEALRKA
ncbi:hypothetical protein BH18ACI2_BH18ACI2_23640 [soil metagenome]